MSSPVFDDQDKRFYNCGKDVAKRLAIVQAGSARHIELHPELAYLFCEHGTYVGAHGALHSCEFCEGKVVV